MFIVIGNVSGRENIRDVVIEPSVGRVSELLSGGDGSTGCSSDRDALRRLRRDSGTSKCNEHVILCF